MVKYTTIQVIMDHSAKTKDYITFSRTVAITKETPLK